MYIYICNTILKKLLLAYSAIYGFNGILLNEDELTNYGRECAKSVSIDRQQVMEMNMMERRQKFVLKVVEYTMDRIQRLKNESGAWVLVVLDGACPPAKKDENKSRRQRRNKAIDIKNNKQARIEDRVAAQHRSGCDRDLYEWIIRELICNIRSLKREVSKAAMLLERNVVLISFTIFIKGHFILSVFVRIRFTISVFIQKWLCRYCHY